MLSTERQEFEDQLAVLFGGFPQFLTQPRIESYWRGLLKMPLPVFTRCVDQVLGERGEEKLPTVNRIWQVSRELRAHAQPQHVDAAPAEDLSIVWAYGNRAMLNYLMRNGGASDSSLQLMLREKKRLCDAYELITSEEPEASLELRDKLFEAWDAVFVPMPRDEFDEIQTRHWERYWNYRRRAAKPVTTPVQINFDQPR
jgi:hypothetical protein